MGSEEDRSGIALTAAGLREELIKKIQNILRLYQLSLDFLRTPIHIAPDPG